MSLPLTDISAGQWVLWDCCQHYLACYNLLGGSLIYLFSCLANVRIPCPEQIKNYIGKAGPTAGWEKFNWSLATSESKSLIGHNLLWISIELPEDFVPCSGCSTDNQKDVLEPRHVGERCVSVRSALSSHLPSRSWAPLPSVLGWPQQEERRVWRLYASIPSARLSHYKVSDWLKKAFFTNFHSGQ